MRVMKMAGKLWRLEPGRSVALVALLLAVPAVPARAQELMPPTASGWTGFAPRPESAPARDVSQNASGYSLSIYGNGVRHVYGGWTTRLQPLQGERYYRFKARAVTSGVASLRESVTIILRWRGSFGDSVRPDYVWDYRVQPDGSLLFDRVIQAPVGTTAVDVELVLQWSPGGRVAFDALSFTPAPTPLSRPVRVAAIYYRPAGNSSGRESVQDAATFAEQVAVNHQPDIMVLGELLNVIGAPGSYDSKAETVPGPSTDVVAAVARNHRVYVVFGILEREGSVLYNTAVLLDRNGTIAGKYRKMQLPLQEASAGLAPGDSVPVFETDFGRVALLICQDASFPEPAREAALQGAELLLVPIWGGKPALVRARAVEHGMYLAASGYDYLSEVVGPLGTVLDAVSSTSAPGVAVADIDLSRRFREAWLGDWRDISNKERRTAPYRHEDSPPPPPDQAAPTVSLTSPASGATVSGSVSLTATASDNVGVTAVRFLLDGTPLGADDTVAPYSISWDSTTAANGAHTLAATASDAAGNSASSSPVTVNVSNGSAPAPVTWTSLVNVTVTGGTLRKTSGCNGCQDAGAISAQTIASGNGYLELTASEATTQRVIGLSNGDTNTTRADIDFGLQFAAGGTVAVRESGLYRSGTSYAPGDIFRVAVEAGVINYYKNGVRIYRSQVAPVYPLLVDTCFFTVGGTLSSVVLASGPGGS